MAIEKEKLLIGAILKNPQTLINCTDISKDDFQSNQCGTVFDIANKLWREKGDADVYEIHKITEIPLAWLVDRQDEGLVSSINFLKTEIKELGKKRRISERLDKILNTVSFTESTEILNEILSIYQNELTEEKKNPAIKEAIERYKQLQHDNRKYGVSSVESGISEFSDKFIDFVRGQMWMIGAYTSIGKTAFMCEIISRIYQRSNPNIIIISTEMTEEMVISRLIANRTGINAKVIQLGRMLPKHREIADAVRDELSEKNIKIYDSIKYIDDIRNAVMLSKLQGGVDVVFLDFIQNIRKPGCRSNYEEKSQIAIDLQNLAKECKTCIVCLSQLTLSQTGIDEVVYKGAGELAEAADIGVILKRHKELKERLLIQVKKNRHGPLCEFIMEYKNDYTRLEELNGTY